MDIRKYLKADIKWKRYMALQGNSGISEYAIGSDYIMVVFKYYGDTVYVYDEQLVEKAHIEKMKTLAERGERLNTYISQHDEIKKNSIKIERKLLKVNKQTSR